LLGNHFLAPVDWISNFEHRQHLAQHPSHHIYSRDSAMEPPPKPSNSLFEVYLRLRPSNAAGAERFLDVQDDQTHITIKPPPTDHRKRAIEKFAFTQVFEENAKQLDVFKGTGVVPLIEGVLGADGSHGRDGLLATLGVTGSGKV
jgi:hypothetical protein